MKTINYPNGFRKYFAFLVCFIGVQFFSVNDLKAQGACDCKNIPKSIDSAPTSCEVYCKLIKSFNRISHADSALINTIALESLDDYYKTFCMSKDTATGGFRFYYGFYDDSIVQIICVANKEYDPDYELGYYVLPNSKKAGYNIDVNKVITKDSVIGLIKTYIDTISIGKFDVDTIVPNDTVKYARYYQYAEIQKLIQEVTVDTGANKKIPAFITFEQCYVPIKISTLYKTHPNIYYYGIPNDFNVGHSTVMYLHEKNTSDAPGDALTRNIPIAPNKFPNNYQSGFLEIGKPCPPRCGEITWEDIIK